MEVDEPENHVIGKPVGVIRGWFAMRDDVEVPEWFEFRLGGVIVPHSVVDRADVEAVLPDYKIVGFTIAYDLSDYLPDIQNNAMVIQLTLPGYDPKLLRFKVEDKALAICLAIAGGV